MKKISVLIVDDSALVRQVLADMVSRDPELEVAGVARDGVEAIRMVIDLDPDVVTMDIHMPEMDGLSALEFIMKKSPRPVLMISALVRKGAVPTLKALEYGAIDFIAKPTQYPSSLGEVREDVTAKIKAAARAKVRGAVTRREPDRGARVRVNREVARGDRVVVIGASAGGPKALSKLVPALPADLPAPVVIVQHMPFPFTESFAARLDEKSYLRVREAADREGLRPGEVLVVPGGKDMALERGEDNSVISALAPTVARLGASPVIDVTMESAARTCGERAIGVLLSGMGTDGAMGLGMIKKAGGDTIAQDEETSLVFGMPRAAIDRGLADRVLPLEQIAAAIAERV